MFVTYRRSFSSFRTQQGQNQDGNHKNIIIVADPQILDRHSYPARPSWLRLLSQIMTDLNMRKGWRAAHRRFRPDYVVFLGDMMDNGRLDMSHEEYVDQLIRSFDLMFAFQVRGVLQPIPERVSCIKRESALCTRKPRCRVRLFMSHHGLSQSWLSTSFPLQLGQLRRLLRKRRRAIRLALWTTQPSCTNHRQISPNYR